MSSVCSVVIRAFNEEKHLSRLLDGILHQTIQDVQVILVDSGSSDRTVEIANEYAVQIVHIQPQDFTFGRSSISEYLTQKLILWCLPVRMFIQCTRIGWSDC